MASGDKIYLGEGNVLVLAHPLAPDATTPQSTSGNEDLIHKPVFKIMTTIPVVEDFTDEIKIIFVYAPDPVV